jgi:hypothetical protein
VECNAPLSAAQVRVDKNVAPAPDGFGAHDGGAHEAARREQLRAFQADLLERIKQQEATKRVEQRAAAARLAAMQELECKRARALAATTSIQLAKALRVAPSPKAAKTAAAPHEPALPADKAAAEEATRPARPASKLQVQVLQMLGAVRTARAGLRARTVGHQRADGDSDDDGSDGSGARDDGAALRAAQSAGSESETEPEEALTFALPVATPRSSSPGVTKQTESARARARERLPDSQRPSEFQFQSPSGVPAADARGRRPSTAPYERASALSTRASLSLAVPQWGRSPEALAVFESVRREQRTAERAYSRSLAQVRTEADDERRRRAAAAEAHAAERARRERAAEVRACARAELQGQSELAQPSPTPDGGPSGRRALVQLAHTGEDGQRHERPLRAHAQQGTVRATGAQSVPVRTPEHQLAHSTAPSRLLLLPSRALAPAALAPAAQAAERSASAEEAELAQTRASKVCKAAQRTRALQQAARYSDALRASLKEKVNQLARPLPSLCACGCARALPCPTAAST